MKKTTKKQQKNNNCKIAICNEIYTLDKVLQIGFE